MGELREQTLVFICVCLFVFNRFRCDSIIRFFVLNNENNEDLEEHIFRLLWSIPAPSNHISFTWRLLLDRVQTKGNMRRHNIIQNTDEAIGTLCHNAKESDIHHFFSCDISWRIWCTCYEWLGYVSSLLLEGKMHFLQHGLAERNKHQRLAL